MPGLILISESTGRAGTESSTTTDGTPNYVVQEPGLSLESVNGEREVGKDLTTARK